MTLLTQVRQVLRRDVQEARWLLLAYTVALGYAAVQGRLLLRPQPVGPDISFASLDTSFGAAVLMPLLLTLLAATLGLLFAPRAGRANEAGHAWHTLPLTSQAVWAARMLWWLAAVLGSLVVTWSVLLALPISTASRAVTAGTIALNTGALLLAVTLLAIAAGTRKRLLLWLVALTVLFPVTALLLSELPVQPAVSDSLEQLLDTLHGGTTLLVVMLALGSAALYALLRSRRVTWGTRAGVAVFACALMLVNAVRTPSAPRPVAERALPSLLNVQDMRASLSQSANSVLLAVPTGEFVRSAVTADTTRARRAAEAVASRASITDRSSTPYTLQLAPTVTATQPTDRLVLRARSAAMRTSEQAVHFRTSDDEVIAQVGDPLPGRNLRWLNAAEWYSTRLFTHAAPGAPITALITGTAEIVLDVERRQPRVLASIPLNGAAADGPWHRFISASVTAPTDSVPAILVHLNRVQGFFTGVTAEDRVLHDFTFALVHPSRAEALHLVFERTFGGSLGWALSPTLIEGHRGILQPSRAVATVASDSSASPVGAHGTLDVRWLDGASLIVIGWHTVEHRALALTVPVTPITAQSRH